MTRTLEDSFLPADLSGIVFCFLNHSSLFGSAIRVNLGFNKLINRRYPFFLEATCTIKEFHKYFVADISTRYGKELTKLAEHHLPRWLFSYIKSLKSLSRYEELVFQGYESPTVIHTKSWWFRRSIKFTDLNRSKTKLIAYWPLRPHQGGLRCILAAENLHPTQKLWLSTWKNHVDASLCLCILEFLNLSPTHVVGLEFGPTLLDESKKLRALIEQAGKTSIVYNLKHTSTSFTSPLMSLSLMYGCYQLISGIIPRRLELPFCMQ
jgi:hypothetical protein